MGWGEAELKLSKQIRADAEKLKALGRISDASYNEAITGAAKMEAYGLAKITESKSDRFKAGIKKIGAVTVGVVTGLLTGGTSGAVAGAANSVQALQSGTVDPSGLVSVDVSTPPIVSPSQQPKPVAMEVDAPPLFILGAWVVVAWVLLKKVLK